MVNAICPEGLYIYWPQGFFYSPLPLDLVNRNSWSLHVLLSSRWWWWYMQFGKIWQSSTNQNNCISGPPNKPYPSGTVDTSTLSFLSHQRLCHTSSWSLINISIIDYTLECVLFIIQALDVLGFLLSIVPVQQISTCNLKIT